MTPTYKLLDPNDLAVFEYFNQILIQYVEHESIVPNPIYYYEDIKKFKCDLKTIKQTLKKYK